MSQCNFGPAWESEPFVYGASKPDDLGQWITFMRGQGIQRVCCLQAEDELDGTVLDAYCREFGENNVKHVPIEDFHLCSAGDLRVVILPFLADSHARKQQVVVHCHGGNGRTGHVLAAWLVFHYGLTPDEAILEVEGMGRSPREAVHCDRATEKDLMQLLSSCRRSPGP